MENLLHQAVSPTKNSIEDELSSIHENDHPQGFQGKEPDLQSDDFTLEKDSDNQSKSRYAQMSPQPYYTSGTQNLFS